MHTSTQPASELAQLEFFVGAWQGHGAFLATEASPAISQPVLRVEAAFCHRGHWLEQRFTWVERPDADPGALDVVEARRIWGFDHAKGQFVSEWFDNRGRRATVTSPGWSGDRLVASAVVVEAGREIHGRETFVRCGSDEWRHLAELDTGQGWVLGEEQVLRRVSAA